MANKKTNGLFVAVNNLDKKEEIDFREKVRQTMIRQIRKKVLKDQEPKNNNK